VEVLTLASGVGAVKRVQQLRLRQLLRVAILGGQRLMRGQHAAIVPCSSTAVGAATPHSSVISCVMPAYYRKAATSESEFQGQLDQAGIVHG
jgi:hypothetical protein